MLKGYFRHYGIPVKVLLLFSLLCLGFGLFTIIGFSMIGPMYGIDAFRHPEILANFNDSDAIPALKWLQLCYSTGLFIFAPILFAYLVSARYWHYMGFNNVRRIELLLATAGIILLAQPWINLMVSINEALNLPDFLSGMESWMREKEENAKLITKSFLEMPDATDLLMNLLVIGLVPALGEELLFRGLIQQAVSRISGNNHMGVWTAAILFSAMHLQFFGFLPRMMLGVLFGYLFMWSCSLWIPILAHFINNAGAVCLQFYLGRNFIESELDTVGTEEGDWVYLVTSGILLACLIIYSWKFRLQRNSQAANAINL